MGFHDKRSKRTIIQERKVREIWEVGSTVHPSRGMMVTRSSRRLALHNELFLLPEGRYRLMTQIQRIGYYLLGCQANPLTD